MQLQSVYEGSLLPYCYSNPICHSEPQDSMAVWIILKIVSYLIIGVRRGEESHYPNAQTQTRFFGRSSLRMTASGLFPKGFGSGKIIENCLRSEMRRLPCEI